MAENTDKRTYTNAGMTITAVTPEQFPAFMELVTEYAATLAESGARVRFTNKPDSIERALFSEPPMMEAIIALDHGEPAGLACWDVSYHLMTGRTIMDVKHYYVRPAHRSRPLALSLLSYMLYVAVQRGYWRVEGRVGGRNTALQRMYASLKAERLDHVTFRLDEPAIAMWASSPGKPKSRQP